MPGSTASCVGAGPGGRCPLDTPVDVVLELPAADQASLSAADYPAVCAVYADVPVVVAGPQGAGRFIDWAVLRCESGDAPSACERIHSLRRDATSRSLPQALRAVMRRAGYTRPVGVTLTVGHLGRPVLTVHTAGPLPAEMRERLETLARLVLGVRPWSDQLTIATRAFADGTLASGVPERRGVFSS